MAVDNLPCALPRDASLHFGKVFIKKVLPDLLISGDIISRSTITLNGQLTDTAKVSQIKRDVARLLSTLNNKNRYDKKNT